MRVKNIYQRPDGSQVASGSWMTPKSAEKWARITRQSHGWPLVMRVRLVRYVDTSESQA